MNHSPILHDPETQEFRMQVGDEIAYITYQITDGKMYLNYSEVPVALRGQSIGQTLVKKTYKEIEKLGYEAVPVCSFIRLVAMRNNLTSS